MGEHKADGIVALTLQSHSKDGQAASIASPGPQSLCFHSMVCYKTLSGVMATSGAQEASSSVPTHGAIEWSEHWFKVN
jgi:hypothetical protein